MNLFDILDDESETEKTEAPTEAPLLTVSQLANTLKSTVEALFADVRLEGEVSRVARPASGHIYFDMKDKNAVINSIIWKGAAQGMAHLPREGDHVIAHGRLTTYPARSNYQMMINRLEPAGEGALLAKLEALKKKLQAEGLFDSDKKQKIPFLPRTIGIITSPTGAVIDDMLHRISARCPRPIMLCGVAVQGERAPQEIAAAIKTFNSLPKEEQPDVLLIARGGGSLEDLMAFNHETVVRAIAASSIPTISAVGHEPDTTLADFAADLRAPTPTAAAELCVPVRADMLALLTHTQKRLPQALQNGLKRHREKLHFLARALPDPTRDITQRRLKLEDAAERLHRAITQQTQQTQVNITNLHTRLNALSPQETLKRGYLYATDTAGKVITSATTTHTTATLTFKDGQRTATLK